MTKNKQEIKTEKSREQSLEEEITDEVSHSEEPEAKLGGDFLSEQLAKATKEASEFRDKYYRVLAESENTRKRLAKEKQDLVAYAIDNFICEVLEPLDNLENALGFTDNLSNELKNWAHGFKMILDQFKEVLANHGVRSFDSVGHPFDPHLHEAVETVEKEGAAEGTILEEVTKGYKHNDRIIRVSRVKVAKSAAKKEAEEEKQI